LHQITTAEGFGLIQNFLICTDLRIDWKETTKPSRLENYLKNEIYLSAVKTCSSVEELEGFWSETQSTDESVEYYPRWDTKKVYICPRGIGVHRGNSSACGRQCESVRGDSEYIYEDEPVLKTLVIRKQLVVDQTACMEGLDEE